MRKKKSPQISLESSVQWIKDVSSKNFLHNLHLQQATRNRLAFYPHWSRTYPGCSKLSKLISKNKTFVDSVVAIPIGDFQHATIEIPFSTGKNTDIKQTTLNNALSEQSWCLNVERTVVANKVMVMTTQEHLETACKRIDHMLVTLYKDNIEDKIDVMTLKKKLSP